MTERRSVLAFAALAILLAGCGNNVLARARGSSAKPYLGETPPGKTPAIFSPERVSSAQHIEFSGSFSPDGTEYYFYRFSASVTAQILCTRVLDDTWTEPERVQVTKNFPAFQPHVTEDNEWLLFAWPNRNPSGIYASQRTDTGWAGPHFAGQGMYETSDSAGHMYTTDMSSLHINGKNYLARVTFDNGVFTAYERLNISTHYGSQTHPCIARDGSYIIFDLGGSHMFISFRNKDGSWGEAIDLAEHGFDTGAGGAYISPDGKYLFFCLNKDIWWVDIKIIDELKPDSKGH